LTDPTHTAIYTLSLHDALPICRRQTNASILGNLCVRERLSCAPARSRASAIREKWSARRTNRPRTVPRPVLFPAPRSHHSTNERPRIARRGRCLGRTVFLARANSLGPPRTNFRKSRRTHGRQQPASPLPDLGERYAPESSRTRR